MTESQRIIFAASHAGDSQAMVNIHFGQLFLCMLISLIIIVAAYKGIEFLINLIHSYINRDTKEGKK